MTQGEVAAAKTLRRQLGAWTDDDARLQRDNHLYGSAVCVQAKHVSIASKDDPRDPRESGTRHRSRLARVRNRRQRKLATGVARLLGDDHAAADRRLAAVQQLTERLCVDRHHELFAIADGHQDTGRFAILRNREDGNSTLKTLPQFAKQREPGLRRRLRVRFEDGKRACSNLRRLTIFRDCPGDRHRVSWFERRWVHGVICVRHRIEIAEADFDLAEIRREGRGAGGAFA